MLNTNKRSALTQRMSDANAMREIFVILRGLLSKRSLRYMGVDRSKTQNTILLLHQALMLAEMHLARNNFEAARDALAGDNAKTGKKPVQMLAATFRKHVVDDDETLAQEKALALAKWNELYKFIETQIELSKLRS